MSKKFYVSQSNKLERQVPALLLRKLYYLITSYNGYDVNETDFVGNIETGYTYDKYLEKINEAFPNLTIVPQGTYVYFEDPELETYIKQKIVDLLYPDNEFEGVPNTIQSLNTGNMGTWGFRQIFSQNINGSAPSDVAQRYGYNNTWTFDELVNMPKIQSLAQHEFRDVKTLTSIDLTNIVKMGSYVFRACDNLQYFNGRDSEIGTLRLPNLSTDGLNGFAFYCYRDSTTGLYKGPQVIKILDLGNCNDIGGQSFRYCKTLEYIDDSVLRKITRFGDYCFGDCENLVINDLKLPNVTEIRQGVFQNTKVKKISELGPCAIRYEAFRGCTSLTTISDEALANIKSLEYDVFTGCSNLVIEDLKLPNLTSIGNNAFKGINITRVSDLGNISLITGFADCASLRYINIPDSANALGQDAFNGCINLEISNSLFSKIISFYNGCLQGHTSLPTVLSLPQCTRIGYTPFKNTNVRSIYLPNLVNTNNINDNSTPDVGRGSQMLGCGPNMAIFYLKNISKINGGAFGSKSYKQQYTFDFDTTHWFESGYEVFGRHYVNGTLLEEYRNDGPLKFKPKGVNTDPWSDFTGYANIKYLVINRTTPPEYWQSSYRYQGNCVFSTFGLYYKSDDGTKETFKYLAVPRSAITAYSLWEGLNPDFSSPNLEEADRTKFISVTSFTNIIAIESMGHFATKAEYDAAPEMPDGVHSKEEYLIEEYMGLSNGETINWDPTPTWSA